MAAVLSGLRCKALLPNANASCTPVHAIGARGEPSRTALDEVNEGGGGI